MIIWIDKTTKPDFLDEKPRGVDLEELQSLQGDKPEEYQKSWRN